MARARTDGARIAAIVLAAGAGSRFGGGKLLAPLEGRPILQHVLERLEAAGLDEVVVVVGADADRVQDSIDPGSARLVVNPTPDEGLSSSLKVGIEALSEDAEAALITLGDQPLLPARAVRALIDAEARPDRPIVVPVYAQGTGRNPVLLRRDAFPLVAQTSGDRGLGPLLDAHPELVEEIPIRVQGGNPDVDTREDLEALLEKAWAAHLDPDDYLCRHDAYHFFDGVGGLIWTGLTGTNVMDVRVILVR